MVGHIHLTLHCPGSALMCGLAGEIRFDGRSASPECLSVMANAMLTRGPDAEGLFLQGRLGLAHRRLSIIDLSDRAQTPMVDSGPGLAIVFNGPHYNYRQLKIGRASGE